MKDHELTSLAGKRGEESLGRLSVLWKLNWICKLNEKCPGNYLNTFNFISFRMTVLIHCNLCEKLSNYFWVIITWNSMTRTPGNHLVIEALIQQIYYLHFAGSGLTSTFLITIPVFLDFAPLSTSEEFFPSRFSGIRKHYWSTFTHHPISRMGISWICTLAY